MRARSILLLTLSVAFLCTGTSRAALFPSPASYPVADQPFRVTPADLNRDGIVDVVTANGASLSVLLGQADGTFGPRTDYETADGAFSAAVGDVSGDGALDLVTANSGAGSLSVLLGNGDGTFRPRADTSTGPFPFPQSVALADLNGDGALDAVTVDGTNLSVYVGLGDGSFPSRVDYADPGAFVVLSLDANADGKPDLASAGFDDVTFQFDRVSVFLGNGDGTLTPRADYHAQSGRIARSGPRPAPRATTQFGNQLSIAAGDLNGDGRADLVTANNEASAVSVLLGVGDGTFPSHVSYGVLDFPSGIAIGDMTGDGKPDLVTANDYSASVSVLRAAGDGTFPSRDDYGANAMSLSLGLADVDRDGRLDVISTGKTPSDVAVLLGRPDGTLAARRTYPTGRFPAGLAVSDLDRDGKLDVVTANSDESTLSILYGAENATLGPRVNLAMSFFSLDVAIGDLNGDADPDIAAVDDDGVLSVYLGLGGRAFAPRIDTSPGSVRQLEIADLNADGRGDVLAIDPGNVSILLGQGDGTFQTPVELPVNGALRVTAADLNADGKPDLVVTQNTLLTIFLGNGDGTFQEGQIVVSGFGAVSASVTDLNADTRADIVTANTGSPGGVSVLLGNGDGTFQDHVDYATGGSETFLATGDLDGDGRPDVAATSGAIPTAGLSILLGRGDGTLGAPTTIAAGRGPGRVAIADLDRDGPPEIVALDRAAFIVSVLRSSRSTTTFHADVTFDPSNVNLANRSALVSAFVEPSGFSTSDIDVSTIRLAGTLIPIAKSALFVDHDGDGLLELQVKFSRADLDPLLTLGVNRLDLTGALTTGTPFRGTGELRARIPSKGPKHVSISPNPIRPQGTITFALDRSGPVRVRVFDRGGSLVRTLTDAPTMDAGTHRIVFDGRSDQGHPVASGIYFYRVETREGSSTGRLAVVR